MQEWHVHPHPARRASQHRLNCFSPSHYTHCLHCIIHHTCRHGAPIHICTVHCLHCIHHMQEWCIHPHRGMHCIHHMQECIASITCRSSAPFHILYTVCCIASITPCRNGASIHILYAEQFSAGAAAAHQALVGRAPPDVGPSIPSGELSFLHKQQGMPH